MTEAHLPIGAYVLNSKTAEWGTGKVLALAEQDRRRVFFEFAGERLMSAAVLVDAPEPEAHPLFSRMDARTDLGAARSFMSMEKAFTDLYEQGFEDAKYLASEREYKMAAVLQMASLCSREELSALLEKEDFAGVCERAKRMVSKTNLIFPNEKMALNDGLKRGAAEQRLFATQLFELLYGDGDMGRRFDGFAAALQELDALKWTTATYFLFLAHPDLYPFVKPTYVQTAAKAYAYELGYEARPNWRCYTRVTGFVRYVADVLARRGSMTPRDLLDVQGFIWCTLQTKPKARVAR